MNRIRKLIAIFTFTVVVLSGSAAFAQSSNYQATGFELISQQTVPDLKAKVYYFKHLATGAQIVYVDNQAETKEISIGFKTPPADNKGANHVLEHSLLCGSNKYPTKNIMHYLQENALAEMINAFTADDCTSYCIKTKNEREFYNLLDVYMNGILDPLLLKDENIFRQQGIRREYVGGQVKYNGVVYNELRIKSLDTNENTLTFLSDQMYQNLYGFSAPNFNSGGTIEGIKSLTYAELLRVYHTYYNPSNCMIYLAGQQDVRKTLGQINDYFKDFQPQQVTIEFTDPKQKPSEKISEYNITTQTKTVDIGFMSSGVLMSKGPKELFAREIIFNIIAKKMHAVHDKNYVVGGNSGGIANLALIISEVPIEKKAQVIHAYQDVLSNLEKQGFTKEELAEKIDQLAADKQDANIYPTEFEIFSGLLYANDPYYYLPITETAAWLKANPSYFTTILQTYFTNNPYSTIVVSGNGAKAASSTEITATPAEIETIKQETAAFNAWADAPDSEQVINSIPTLTLADIPTPTYPTVQKEISEGITYYANLEQSAESNHISLYFPLTVQTDDLTYLQLLCSFLQKQAEKQGLTEFFFDLSALENYQDGRTINPHLSVGVSLPKGQTGEQIKKLFTFLTSDQLWDQAAFSKYLSTAAAQILADGYRDPYFVSYELMTSDRSLEDRFFSVTRGSTGQGSITYYQFLKNKPSGQVAEDLAKLKGLGQEIILKTIPVVEYCGNSADYQALKTALGPQFKKALSKTASSNLTLPAGYKSAVTITNLTDANHFMLTGFVKESGYQSSGKMNVLAKVISAKYLLPTMRGKYGAYGAGMNFYNNSIVCSVAGLSDVDQALTIWQGMGDFLRNLEMSQKELDGIIISAVNEYDQYDDDSGYGAFQALRGKTVQDVQKVRQEMLQTTVADIKGYAKFMDDMVAQERVFAVLSQADAQKAKFKFAYTANAQTLEVTANQ